MLRDVLAEKRPSALKRMYCLSGACLAATVEVWPELQGFDECFFLYDEDTDLSMRASASGIPRRIAPGAVVIHEGGTRRRGLQRPAVSAAIASEQQIWKAHHLGPSWLLWLLQRGGCLMRALIALVSGHLTDALTYLRIVLEGPGNLAALKSASSLASCMCLIEHQTGHRLEL